MMRVVAFYSYKGGVGRTLAAANFAAYLAKLGLNVVVMDFDLDAPGIDSKFADFTLPAGQLGLIDYILRFQRDDTGPGAIDEIICEVKVASPRQDYSLGLIPAGDYLAEDYPEKLNELDWSWIFSPERAGVAFFQTFLDRIEEERAPEVLIIDARTGFSEIGGLCTQQLADETVILSALSAESIKMTRHLAKLIRESKVARELSKTVDTKIVVSRVPKPRDIDKLKAQCCKWFEVDETKLFFLFSCRLLESDEFVAMLNTEKEDELTANYIQLFQGLDVEVARESIREEIERYEKGLLSCTPPQAEARIREMVALYPDPEIYRRAMRFFDLTRRPEEACMFGVKLLDMRPHDEEAESRVARFFLAEDQGNVSRLTGRRRTPKATVLDVQRLLEIAEHAYKRGLLSSTETVRLADALEDVRNYEKSFQIATACLELSEIDDDARFGAIATAARTAKRLGKNEVASKLVAQLPPQHVASSTLGPIAVQAKLDGGDEESAFELAKFILSQHPDGDVMRMAGEIAVKLDRQPELQELIQMQLEMGNINDPESLWRLEQLGFTVGQERRRPSRRSARRRSESS